LNVYYKIPDSANEEQNKLLGLLYENFRLRILLALAPIEKMTRASKGIILIERMEETVELRYEGFTPELELICKWHIAQIKEKQKVRY